MACDVNNRFWILTFGLDSSLLYTRELLLASAGYCSDTASKGSEVSAALRSNRPYKVILLCHTVGLDDRNWVQKVVQQLRPGTPIYIMTKSLYPAAFLAHFNEFIGAPQDASFAQERKLLPKISPLS